MPSTSANVQVGQPCAFWYFNCMLPAQTTVLVQNSMVSPLGGISLAGVVRRGEGVPIPNRILGRYSLVYVFDGSGFYTDDKVKNIPVHPGDIIQISPETRHGYGPRLGLNWHEVYIIFEGPIFDTWFERNCFQLPRPVTRLTPIDYWRDRFLTAIGTGEGSAGIDGISEVIRLQSLMLDIHQALTLGNEDEDDWLNRAKAALTDCSSAQDAASSMRMSYEAFRKRFRRAYGVPPARFHANLQMEQACDMLTQTQEPIREIARRLDFCDEFHFSKRFSQIIGCSPSTYRSRTYQY